MTIEEEKRVRDLVQQIRDLKTAMCCYDEMLVLLDLVSAMWCGNASPELSAALTRMERFDIERLVKNRLPDVMKAAKRARLMRNSDPYWPENYNMSLFVETPA